MFILKKGHQPGVYVPLRALFLVFSILITLPAPISAIQGHLSLVVRKPVFGVSGQV